MACAAPIRELDRSRELRAAMGRRQQKSLCRGNGSHSERSGKGRASDSCGELIRPRRKGPLSKRSGSYTVDIREKPTGSGPRIANPHTSKAKVRDQSLVPLPARGSNAIKLLCLVRQCICNSKVGVKPRRKQLRRYYYCQKNPPVDVAVNGRIYTVAIGSLAPNRWFGETKNWPIIALLLSEA
jgi:hypothetical protein